MQTTDYRATVAVLRPDHTWEEFEIEGGLTLAEWDGDPDGVSFGEVVEEASGDARRKIPGEIVAVAVLDYQVADGDGNYGEETEDVA